MVAYLVGRMRGSLSMGPIRSSHMQLVLAVFTAISSVCAVYPLGPSEKRNLQVGQLRAAASACSCHEVARDLNNPCCEQAK